MALMANVLYIARNIEIEDPGFVIHRASSALVVWAGAGGIVNAAIVSYLVYSAATRPGKIFGLNITGRQVREIDRRRRKEEKISTQPESSTPSATFHLRTSIKI